MRWLWALVACLPLASCDSLLSLGSSDGRRDQRLDRGGDRPVDAGHDASPDGASDRSLADRWITDLRRDLPGIDRGPDIKTKVDQPPPDRTIVDWRPDLAPAADAKPDSASKPDLAATDGGGCVTPFTESCNAGWCTIPAGCFHMGSPASESCRSPNETLHQVKLTHPFLISAYEVTQDDFSAKMGYNPSSKICTGCPVEMVNWSEAAAYCNSLSTAASLALCYSCSGSQASTICLPVPLFSSCPGYRLPTEAEFEHATRAGTSTAFYAGNLVGTSCGNNTDPTADAIGWYFKNASNTEHAVGQKQKNAAGLYDMAGNVYEWASDWYQADLGTATVTDPPGPAADQGQGRVMHGGSYFSYPQGLRSASRNYGDPATRYQSVGFRCARSL
jgi:formylglycine-generating enzyme